MSALPSDANARFEMGNALRSQGRLDEAAASYHGALELKSDFAEAHNNLGIVLFAQNRMDDAVNSFRAALSSRPDYADAFANLGVVLHTQGHLCDAVDVYRKSLTLDSENAEVCNNLGTILVVQGRLDEAVDNFRSAISAQPDFAGAHINLANALKDQGKLEEAVTSYNRALELRPDMAIAHNNLGSLLNELGQTDAAIASCRHALELEEAPQFKANFVNCIKNRSFREIDPAFRRLVIRAIAEPWAWQSELTNLAASLIRIDQGMNEAIERASSAWPSRLSARELFGDCGLPAFANDLLLRTLLENAPVCDVAMERLLTMVRCTVLDAVTDATLGARLGNETLDFYCAIARQCYINEYVFSCDDAELERAKSLREKLVAALDSENPVPASWIAAVAAYWPLSEISSATKLLDQPWPDSLAALLAQQIAEPREEQRLRNDVKRLTALEGDVTRSVLQQYEENPYPRWIKMPEAIEARSIDDFLRQELPAATFRPLGKDGNVDILIAGCGTGLESIATAQRFPTGRILAIDLSLSSLCYAKRKTRELGFENIEYAQADILKLGSVSRTFDVITSMGVLHHLADPVAGLRELLSLLRPGGVIRLGLYSELARQAVVAAREYIAARGYATNSMDIRRCRQDLVNWNKGNQFQQLTTVRDFYVTSECRDLLFHTQEHRFSLPQIKEIIARFDLNFLGFAALDRSVINEYSMRFKDDPSRTNLDYWHFFELEFPNTFTGMYQFWSQKANADQR